MNLIILGEAASEFKEAAHYYKAIDQSLALRFENEVISVLHRVSGHPETLRLRPGGYRRANLRIFPYYISYVVRGSNLWIVAIAHSRRKPLYWIERTKKIT